MGFDEPALRDAGGHIWGSCAFRVLGAVAPAETHVIPDDAVATHPLRRPVLRGGGGGPLGITHLHHIGIQKI